VRIDAIALNTIEFSMGKRMFQLFEQKSRYTFGARSFPVPNWIFFADRESDRCARGLRGEYLFQASRVDRIRDCLHSRAAIKLSI